MIYTQEEQTRARTLGKMARWVVEGKAYVGTDTLFVLDILAEFFIPDTKLSKAAKAQREKWQQVAKEKGITIE